MVACIRVLTENSFSATSKCSDAVVLQATIIFERPQAERGVVDLMEFVCTKQIFAWIDPQIHLHVPN